MSVVSLIPLHSSPFPPPAQNGYTNPPGLCGQKVSVRFQPIGSAPILKQKVFKISASSRFSVVLNFLRKKVGVREGDGLFLYVNSVFAPGLDEGVGNLFRVCSSSSCIDVLSVGLSGWLILLFFFVCRF